MSLTRPPVVLTVAASDSAAGTGVQGDLKVFAALRAYGVSVVTAINARNTRTTADVYPLPASVVAVQLGTVLDDLPPAAVKVGMLASAEAAATVAARARSGELPNLVLDPVLDAPGGRRMGVLAAIERLLPHATVATPNREQASALLGWAVVTPADMAGAAGQLAAGRLATGGPRHVVVTGGDLVAGDEAVDALWTDNGARFLRYPRIHTRNTYGAGNAFSAAVAARLAGGEPAPEAIAAAKQYVARALAGAREWKLGDGPGPLNHST